MFLPVFQRFLNQRRMNYAFVLGAAMWLPWCISVAAGPGRMDLAGHPVGSDYLAFYTAGYALRLGLSPELYDFATQAQIQQLTIGLQLDSLYAYIAPPHLAGLFAPLALLPYEWSFAVWSLASLAFLVASLQLLGAPVKDTLPWCLTWYCIHTSFSFGQTSLLSLFLLSAVYALWRARRLVWAGLVLSALMYKPYLAVGVAVLWFLQGRRDHPALLGLLVGTVTTAVLSFVLLPEASIAYVSFAKTVLPNLAAYDGFPLWNQHAVRGFWQLLLPHLPRLSNSLTILAALAALAGFALFWRRLRLNCSLVFGGAVSLAIMLAPHLMIYDLALLLVPALLLWLELPTWRSNLRAIFGITWLTTLLSPFFTLLQQKVLPVALQISVLVLAYCMVWLWRNLPSFSAMEQPAAPQESPLSVEGAP